jgi:hypothetical protein
MAAHPPPPSSLPRLQLTRKLKATEGAVGEERDAADGGLAKAEGAIADLTKRVNDTKRVSRPLTPPPPVGEAW